MSVTENPKKRSFSQDEKETEDEPFARTAPSDIKVIYDVDKGEPIADVRQPSVWRLTEILNQFKVGKIQISQSGYKMFNKMESCQGLATISLCKGSGTVELHLFCEGDGLESFRARV